jgi:glycosyltransferase involved in cell wall biosynthesis
MKILLISNTSRSLYNFRSGLMDALKENGFRVALCASFDEYTPKLQKKGFRIIPVKLDRKGKNPLKDMMLIASFYRILNREKPDLALHFSIKPNIYGAIAARLAGVKCINTVTGLGYVFIEESLLLKFVKILYKISFRFPENIFFQNNHDLNFFMNKNIINKNKAILVSGSGVNVKYFHPDFCKGFKRKNKNFVFLFVGRLLWDKGINQFVKASEIVRKKYPQTEFCLLGRIDKGNPNAVPEKVIRDWEKEKLIKYLGTTYDVRSFICQSDAVVLPSFYREGLPRSLLEGMAMAKPIITTDFPGCREVVEDGKNGFLVCPKDHDALARAMVQLIELSFKEREKLGSFGREKAVKEFDENNIINSYLEAITAIVRK